MIDIKEIYQWYRQTIVTMPKHLTSIQKEEWEKAHPNLLSFIQQKEWEKANPDLSDKIQYKSFVGEDIVCPAVIKNITRKSIEAYSQYFYDTRVKLKAGQKEYELENIHNYSVWELHPHYTSKLDIEFFINYDNSTFYEKLKEINIAEMIEFKGKILKLEWEISEDLGYGPFFSLRLEIYLALSNIKKIKSYILYADQLGEKISLHFLRFEHRYRY